MLRLYDFICKHCKKPFRSRDKRRKYCCRKCAYADRIGMPRHPNAGRKRTKKPTRFICQYCGKPFERMVSPSRPTRQFCSPACRNKARKLKKVHCPICGKLFSPQVIDVNGVRRQHCSRECAYIAQKGKPSPKRTPKRIRDMVARVYPEHGPEPIMEKFGLTRSAVCQIASKDGITLNDNVYYERVHEAARQYMTDNNPMHNPETVQKVLDYYQEHPDKDRERRLNIVRAQRKVQKKNPTKLELQLFGYLDELGIDYEPYCVIKPKFIVDVKIGDLIIQADGDYWHGHPSRAPLTKRQKAQQRRDRAQDKYLTACGYTVVRIWESDISKELVIDILKHHANLLT